MKFYPLSKEETKDCNNYRENQQGLLPLCDLGGFCIEPFSKCSFREILEIINEKFEQVNGE